MKKKIIYIHLFRIMVAGVLIIGLVITLALTIYSNRENFTNNGLDIHNNLSFTGNMIENGGNGGNGGKWGPDIAKQFLNLQSTINPQYIFNINVMQKYVSKDEMKQFLSNGKWNWSDKTKNDYLSYMKKNTGTKNWVDAAFDMKDLQTIYPESFIKELLMRCNNKNRNEITGFLVDYDDSRILYEGIEKNGSGIGTFGVSSGLLSNGYSCYHAI